MGRVASHLAALAVVFVFLMIGAMAWFPSPPTRDELAARERKHLARQCAAALNLDEQYLITIGEIVHAECRCGRDTADWMMVRVPPGEVSRIRRAIVRDEHTAHVPRSDDDLLRYYRESKPAWWTPTKLPDARIVLVGEVEGTVYVFSEKTGTIYVMTWTV